MTQKEVAVRESTNPLTAARRQQILIELLVCPKCHRRLDLVDSVSVDSAVVKADITCTHCGPVGLINAFRPSFLARDLDDARRAPGLVPEWVALSLSHLPSSGPWETIHEGLRGAESGTQLGGLISGRGIRFELLTHRWSGQVQLDFAGRSSIIDLRSDTVGRHVEVMLADENDEHAWSLTVLDGGLSGVDQVILQDLYQYVEPQQAKPIEYVVENLGNPYPPRFNEMLQEYPAEAVILDLGGGDRRHPDPRVLNLEYLPYRRVDLYGDGLELPFADDSFDFIMSQAVLEHVPDPFKAVSEMKRVLKPGGRLYAEFAFMQPLHAVPFHFFNITPHGAVLLFEKWDDVRIAAFGGLGETMRWFFRLLDADQKLGAERAEFVIESLDALDALLHPGELEMLSSAVSVEATAPKL